MIEMEYEQAVGESAICWAKIGNLRIKTSIPLTAAKEFQYGDIFIWDEINQIARRIPSRGVEYKELLKEYDRLAQEYNNRLIQDDGELISEKGCASFEICKLNQNEEWESIHEESYCNFGKMPKEFKKYLKENL